ncbi:MAG: ABC transporter ATP-binding protein [Candidatus Cloacimonadales bacterium]
MNILNVKDLKKSYKEASGKLEILKGVDLQINAGETVAITGQSGSGKSTLLHILGMLDNYDSGSIEFMGKKISANDRKINQFRNQQIGFVFQFHYLLEDFTAEENVAMPAFIRSGNHQQSLQAARKLLDKLDILPRKDHYPNQLSGGEQQRVAFARALVNNPKIILADEPTGNLDATHSEELIQLLLQLNREFQQTFVIVTHNQQIAARMQKNYYLKNGVLSLNQG